MIPLFLLCSLLALAAGCSRAAPRKAATKPALPAKIVLDYRYGWYHPATGSQTLAQIAGEYGREPALLAQLNQSDPAATPYPGKMIYIPPNNDRAYLREVLVKINQTPGIVPQTPFRPEKTTQVATPLLPIELKQPATELKTKTAATLKLAPVVPAPQPTKKPAADTVASRTAQKKETAPLSRERRVASVVTDTDGPSGLGRAARATGKNGFAWPLEGKVVTPFSEGWRKACHGIEIAVPEGSSVRASRAGKVLLAQEFPGYGNLILIDHGDGFASVYAYLKTMKVKEGDRAKQGDIIAASGNKHSSPLLFFQIRRKGVKVDPMEFLP